MQIDLRVINMIILSKKLFKLSRHQLLLDFLLLNRCSRTKYSCMLLTSPPIITIPVALLEDNEAILRITAKVISSSFNISSLRRRMIVVSPSS